MNFFKVKYFLVRFHDFCSFVMIFESLHQLAKLSRNFYCFHTQPRYISSQQSLQRRYARTNPHLQDIFCFPKCRTNFSFGNVVEHIPVLEMQDIFQFRKCRTYSGFGNVGYIPVSEMQDIFQFWKCRTYSGFGNVEHIPVSEVQNIFRLQQDIFSRPGLVTLLSFLISISVVQF